MNIFKKIKTIIYPADIEPVYTGKEITGITIDKKEIAKFMRAVAQLYADETEKLNSGVMIKDGTVGHNMN